jgi:hypothetical protein
MVIAFVDETDCVPRFRSPDTGRPNGAVVRPAQANGLGIARRIRTSGGPTAQPFVVRAANGWPVGPEISVVRVSSPGRWPGLGERPGLRPVNPQRSAVWLCLILPALFCFTLPAMADEPARLACTPRTFQVLPGEPIRVELTVEADSAAPVRIRIPADPLLTLRAVEKLPVERTPDGVIVHRRVVLWQALEPGTATLNALSVETQGRKLLFPQITVTARDPGP